MRSLSADGVGGSESNWRLKSARRYTTPLALPVDCWITNTGGSRVLLWHKSPRFAHHCTAEHRSPIRSRFLRCGELARDMTRYSAIITRGDTHESNLYFQNKPNRSQWQPKKSLSIVFQIYVKLDGGKNVNWGVGYTKLSVQFVSNTNTGIFLNVVHMNSLEIPMWFHVSRKIYNNNRTCFLLGFKNNLLTFTGQQNEWISKL